MQKTASYALGGIEEGVAVLPVSKRCKLVFFAFDGKRRRTLGDEIQSSWGKGAAQAVG
jgi:hypothetical protein